MKKILVADDDDIICELYACELGEEGYEVVTTSQGSQVLEMIEQHRPELVVLDIRMGDHDGLTLLQDIRNLYYDLPVILCSAYSTFKYDLRSVATDHYVVKDIDLRELKMKINRALETTHYLLSSEVDEAMGNKTLHGIK